VAFVGFSTFALTSAPLPGVLRAGLLGAVIILFLSGSFGLDEVFFLMEVVASNVLLLFPRSLRVGFHVGSVLSTLGGLSLAPVASLAPIGQVAGM
jgi:hypothetical protein